MGEGKAMRYGINLGGVAGNRSFTDFELIRLTPHERDAFVATLRKPPAPGARLAQAAEDYKKKMGA